MMQINIIAVGGLKEKYLKEACLEYTKRISAFAKVDIIEIKEAQLTKGVSPLEIEQAKLLEARQIKEKAKGFLISLEIEGESLSSEEFAKKLENIAVQGNSEISFIIGGSHGIDKNFSSLCNMRLSFSKFTLPHQLIRVVLLEQIYRAMCINNNKTYHK